MMDVFAILFRQLRAMTGATARRVAQCLAALALASIASQAGAWGAFAEARQTEMAAVAGDSSVTVEVRSARIFAEINASTPEQATARVMAKCMNDPETEPSECRILPLSFVPLERQGVAVHRDRGEIVAFRLLNYAVYYYQSLPGEVRELQASQQLARHFVAVGGNDVSARSHAEAACRQGVDQHCAGGASRCTDEDNVCVAAGTGEDSFPCGAHRPLLDLSDNACLTEDDCFQRLRHPDISPSPSRCVPVPEGSSGNPNENCRTLDAAAARLGFDSPGPIYDENSPGGNNCRAPYTSAECREVDALKPVGELGLCRAAASDEDCAREHPTAPRAVLGADGSLLGSCRPKTSVECIAESVDTPISDPGEDANCRAAENIEECRSAHPALPMALNGRCVEEMAACPTGSVNSHAPALEDCRCPEQQVIRDGACAAPASGVECQSLNPPSLYDPSRNACVQECPPTHALHDDGVFECRAAREGDCPIRGQIPTTSDIAQCECPPEFDLYESAGVCAPPLVAASASAYGADDCHRAGWQSQTTPHPDRNLVAETCLIPAEISAVHFVPSNAPAAPVTQGTLVNECILRSNPGFGDAIPLCSDAGLFGSLGSIPAKPADFRDGGRILVVPAATPSQQPEVYAPDENGIYRKATAIASDAVVVQSDDGPIDEDDIPIIGAGFAVAIAGAWLFGFYGQDDIRFAPHASYQSDGGMQAWNYGVRADYGRQDWNAWLVAQRESAGDFVYLSGGSLSNGFWTASYETREAEKRADYSFSLSAGWEAGTWTISPAYRFAAGYGAETPDWAVDDSLSIDMLWRSWGWAVRHAAGFAGSGGFAQWQDAPHIRVDIERKF